MEAFNAAQNCLRLTLVGQINDECMRYCHEQIYQDPQFVQGMNHLMDLSQADMNDVSSAGLRKLMHLSERYATQSFRTAIVAPQDLSFGLSRLYQILSSDSPEEVMVFRSLLEANYWLGLEFYLPSAPVLSRFEFEQAGFKLADCRAS